ncbi:MAG TPA: toxin-antitoxin system HicB family antitoxin [Thermoanaerobaculia bacterium]|nr:toxin-antitoxin system HicB family antitoxin [Thermoanaerobaculia bacterium]
MANLQVKNLPEPLHARLRRYARQHHRTISDVALAALERELNRCEWYERHAQHPATDLGVSASSLLEEERSQRQRELE